MSAKEWFNHLHWALHKLPRKTAIFPLKLITSPCYHFYLHYSFTRVHADRIGVPIKEGRRRRGVSYRWKESYREVNCSSGQSLLAARATVLEVWSELLPWTVRDDDDKVVNGWTVQYVKSTLYVFVDYSWVVGQLLKWYKTVAFGQCICLASYCVERQQLESWWNVHMIVW